MAKMDIVNDLVIVQLELSIIERNHIFGGTTWRNGQQVALRFEISTIEHLMFNLSPSL